MDDGELTDREIAEAVLGGPIPPAEAKSRVEARTLASGHVVWTIAVVPGTVPDDDLLAAVDLAKVAIARARQNDVRRVSGSKAFATTSTRTPPPPERMKLVDAITDCPMTMAELVTATGLSDLTIRKHLRVIEDSDLNLVVNVGPRGKKVYSIEPQKRFKVRKVAIAP